MREGEEGRGRRRLHDPLNQTENIGFDGGKFRHSKQITESGKIRKLVRRQLIWCATSDESHVLNMPKFLGSGLLPGRPRHRWCGINLELKDVERQSTYKSLFPWLS